MKLTDEKKLELIRKRWNEKLDDEDKQANEKFIEENVINDVEADWYSMGFLDALRQLGPVIELVNKINETSLEWGLEAEDALRQAGLEE